MHNGVTSTPVSWCNQSGTKTRMKWWNGVIVPGTIWEQLSIIDNMPIDYELWNSIRQLYWILFYRLGHQTEINKMWKSPWECGGRFIFKADIHLGKQGTTPSYELSMPASINKRHPQNILPCQHQLDTYRLILDTTTGWTITLLPSSAREMAIKQHRLVSWPGNQTMQEHSPNLRTYDGGPRLS